MAWQKKNIQLENGTYVEAQSPQIISASRSTDIPAFYCDWFFYRLQKGYSAWTNPFNGVKSYISYADTRFIVFWSKNPRPLLAYLDVLKTRRISCYIQYTLNDYEKEGLEQGVPELTQRIETFKLLVDKLGMGRVIWRFDPLILTDQITMDDLLRKIKYIGDKLIGYTEKLVFSFADIASYKKVKNNLDKHQIHYVEWSESMMAEFAERLSKLNRSNWNYILATCGEKINLEKFGIDHNHCVDDNLMIRFAWQDKTLMDFLKVDIHQYGEASNLFDISEEIPTDAVIIDDTHYAIKKKNNKDKGQRFFCGCVISKDIGEYNTCPHLCEYCYANTSKDAALRNYEAARQKDFKGESII